MREKRLNDVPDYSYETYKKSQTWRGKYGEKALGVLGFSVLMLILNYADNHRDQLTKVVPHCLKKDYAYNGMCLTEKEMPPEVLANIRRDMHLVLPTNLLEKND